MPETIVHKNARSFLDSCLGWLLRSEDYYNLLISTVDSIEAGAGVFAPPHWLAHVESGGEVIGCAVHTQEDGLLVSRMPESAATEIARLFSKDRGETHRISGEPETINWISRELEKLSSAEHELDYQWNIYRLDTPPAQDRAVGGHLRQGSSEEDARIVLNWSKSYELESPAPIDIGEFFNRKLANKELYIWDRDGPRAVATTSGPTLNGIRISSVYTSSASRKFGYASALVASLSSKLLQDGFSFVTLSALQGHPSEKMYGKLGYRHIGKRSSIRVSALRTIAQESR